MKIKQLVEDVGGPTRAAQICDVQRTAVYRWYRQGWIRTSHLEKLVKAAGLKVERYWD